MTKQATPPPPGDKPSPSAPPPPPTWRHWLWPAGDRGRAGAVDRAARGALDAAGLAELLAVPVQGHRAPGQVDRPGPERPDQHRRADRREALHHRRAGAGRLLAADRAAEQQGPDHRSTHRRVVWLGGAVLGDHPAAAAAVRLHLVPAVPQRSGRRWPPGHHGRRPVPGQGLRRRAAHHPVRRRGRVRRGQAGDQRGRRLPQERPTATRRSGRCPRAACSWSGRPAPARRCIARAVAGEAEVPFFSVAGSSFVELFVGVGAARVRDLFSEARKRAPCIIFVDEIDAIGQRRSGGQVYASNDEREQTLNQLLAEMDGFDPATGHRRAGRDQPPRGAGPGAAAPGPVRPAGHHPAAERQRAGRDPGRALPGQAGRPGRGPERGRPRHPRLLRRRPGQPGQRGRDLRGPGRAQRHHRRRLRRGPGPHPARPPRGLQRAAARGEEIGRGARGRPRHWSPRCPRRPTRWPR